MRKTVIAIVLLALTMPVLAQKGFVIDHTTADIQSIPPNWIDSAKAKLKIRYFRRSHGSHIDVGGMAALRRYSAEYAEKYNYNSTGAGGALKFSTKWHSLDFENVQWVQITKDFLDAPENADINVMMWAWSSQFYQMDVDRYLMDMETLIADYGPNGTKIENGDRSVPVIFIFHTACGQKSLSRNELVFIGNKKIREHCQDNNRILFDFNDIETYNPDGEYFGDANPDGTYTNERLLDDDCSYKRPTGGRGNWGIEWYTANPTSELTQLSTDEICTTCEHSMGTHQGETKDNSRLHCVLKGQAAWWLFAKLAGWGQVGLQESVTISSEQALVESNLNGQTLSVELSACSFTTANPALKTFVLNNAPNGLSIKNISVTAVDKATLTLAFDGTDFTNDIPNFSLSISSGVTNISTMLTSNELLITAGGTINSVWTGAVNDDWNNPTNWSTGQVPGNENDVIIPTGLEFYPETNSGSSFQINSLKLESGTKLQLPPANSIQISTDLELFSTDGEYAQIIDSENINVTGNILYNKFLKGRVYHYITSPLSTVPSTVFTNTPKGFNRNFYVYLESNTSNNWLAGWNHEAAIGNLHVGRGYAYYYSNDHTFQLTGGQLYSGDISVDIYHSNNQVISDGWNIVGNPYPSAVSADEFIFENQDVISGTIYFWDDDNSGGSDYNVNDYASWNLAGAIGTGTGGTSEGGTKIPDGFIAPMQGFFVKKISPGNSQLWFRNSMRKFGNGQYFKSQRTITSIKLGLANKSDKLYNEILVAFVEDASNRYDNLYDGFKLRGNPDIAFYSLLNRDEMGIQTFKKPINQETIAKSVALGFEVTKANYYEISIVKELGFSHDAIFLLEDKTLMEVNELKKGSYRFYSEKGKQNNRFVLHINPSKRGLANLLKKANKPKVYYARNAVVIEAKENCFEANYIIYNLKGYPLSRGSLEGSRTEVPIESQHRAALVKIDCPDCDFAEKIMLD